MSTSRSLQDSGVFEETDLTRLAESLHALLERRFWLWTSLLLTILFLCSVYNDLHFKMWIDELYTLGIAQQAGPRQIEIGRAHV